MKSHLEIFFRSSHKRVVNTKHLETVKTIRNITFYVLSHELLTDSLQLMRSGNIVSENSQQIYVVPHLKSLIIKRKEGKKYTMSVYYFSPRPTAASCADDWQSFQLGLPHCAGATLSWWSLDDRFKTELDYGISLPKTTASSVRESCRRAAQPLLPVQPGISCRWTVRRLVLYYYVSIKRPHLLFIFK